jgi:hypothetical protein
MADSKDEKELSYDLSKDIEVRKKKDTIAVFAYLTLILFALLIVGGYVIFNLFSDVQKARVEAAQTKQYVYNLVKNQERQNRRTIAIEDACKVILYYNPTMNEWICNQAGTIMYEVGELKYNIPVEESILFFALESRFKRTALSVLGAKGVGQLMEDTARWGAVELGIQWEGDITLYDYLKNIRISLFVYKKYRERFNYEFHYYLAAYFWGPTTIGKFYDSDQKLKGKYLTYLKDWKVIKKEVEKVLGRPITIPGYGE